MTSISWGLIGPLGALPNYVTELISQRIRAKDHTMLAFLNIFNHRLTSFFYQAWEKNHFTVAYERGRGDPLSECLFAWSGLAPRVFADASRWKMKRSSTTPGCSH
jgi:type VI secretion system protein ImpH